MGSPPAGSGSDHMNTHEYQAKALLNEFGVPILSKIPYLNRLFKNVGIGRETQSLMMMVTPRIIIQEEEEAKLGIQSGP